MDILWNKRIAHIDRPVRPHRVRGLRLQLLALEVRERRGLPTRGLPSAYVHAQLKHRLADKWGIPVGAAVPSKDALERMRLRYRLAQPRHARLAEARRRRRPSVHDTSIYLWKRRAAWLHATAA